VTDANWAVVPAALGATVFFALSTGLKHRSAGQPPVAGMSARRSTGQFLLATARHPLWLGGIGADVGGFALQVVALHLGALAVVQPLLITALLFSLIVNHKIAGTRVSKRELAGGAALVAALVAFLVASGASSPHVTGPAQTADRTPAVALALGSAAVLVLCVLLASRLGGTRGTALLGVAVGVTYACTAALIKSCSDVALSAGPVALLTGWQLYLLVAAGATGLILSQLAFRAGPLRASLPAIATVDPLLSIAFGVLVYDEHLRTGTSAVLAELGCLLVLSAAVVYLSLIRGVQEAPERTREPAAISR
jgi:drug/metabolite transporter (DMT)-like permease